MPNRTGDATARVGSCQSAWNNAARPAKSRGSVAPCSYNARAEPFHEREQAATRGFRPQAFRANADGGSTDGREVAGLAESSSVQPRRTVGLRDIPRALVSPRQVFERVEDVAAWGWPLLVLLTLVTLIGYATIQTGLIDREVERGVRESIARLDQQQRDVVQRSELRELYDREIKAGEFRKLLTRVRVVGAEPAKALATALLIAAALYGVVALTGRKPEWHTLLTIVVLAGFVDALRLLVTLGLMLHFETLEVDTSAALLVRLWHTPETFDPKALAATAGTMTALDPFRVWYWLLVVTGLKVTMQLPGWRAWLVCVLAWLVGAVARAGLTVAMVPGAMSMGGGGN